MLQRVKLDVKPLGWEEEAVSTTDVVVSRRSSRRWFFIHVLHISLSQLSSTRTSNKYKVHFHVIAWERRETLSALNSHRARGPPVAQKFCKHHQLSRCGTNFRQHHNMTRWDWIGLIGCRLSEKKTLSIPFDGLQFCRVFNDKRH